MTSIKVKNRSSLLKDIKRNYHLYLLSLPVISYFVIFHYIPMYGIQIAFRDYIPVKGFLGSPWVGFENFNRFFDSFYFWDILKNTLGISIYQLAAGFPLPIIFALFLNYISNERFKKTLQMVSYAPNFISTVVMVGIITIFLAPHTGLFNQIGRIFGLEDFNLLAEPEWFKSIYVWSGVWQNMGWNSIIYISALSSVDVQMHEAAIVDGASKVKRIWHIDLPSIAPTIVILLILSAGNIMNVGFEKVFLLQNELNLSSSEVISTNIFKIGIQHTEYSYSTAVGMFNSVINFALLVIVNAISKRLSETSLW